jgi:hypothetical protein
MVLQAPTVGAPYPGPSAVAWRAWLGGVETVSAMAAPSAAQVRVSPEIDMNPPPSTQAS